MIGTVDSDAGRQGVTRGGREDVSSEKVLTRFSCSERKESPICSLKFEIWRK